MCVCVPVCVSVFVFMDCTNVNAKHGSCEKEEIQVASIVHCLFLPFVYAAFAIKYRLNLGLTHKRRLAALQLLVLFTTTHAPH